MSRKEKGVAQRYHEREFLKRELFVVLVLLLLTASLGLAFYFSNNSGQETVSNVATFLNYVQSISSLIRAISILFDMFIKAIETKETTIVNPFTTNYYGNSWGTTLEQQTAAVIRRTIDDVPILLIQFIKSQLPWNLTSSLLYDPICSANDTSCSSLLRGAFNRGLQASLIEFVYSTVSTMYLTSNKNYQLHKAWTLRQASQLTFAYYNYLRPQLLVIQQRSYEVLNLRLEDSSGRLTTMLWKVCLPVFVCLMMVVGLMVRRRQSASKHLWAECMRQHRLAIQIWKEDEVQKLVTKLPKSD